MKLRLNLLIYFLFVFFGSAQAQADSLLSKLNATLADKEVFVKQKQRRIENLSRRVPGSHDLNTKYTLYQKLFDEYKAFSYDSAYNYAKKLQVTAAQLNDPARQALAKMELSFTLISSGMFKETLETLNQIDVKLFTDSDKVEYYFLKGRSYFDLSDFDRNADYSAIYNPKGIQCIDSALSLSKPGSYYFLALSGLKDLRAGDYASGIKHYTILLSLPNLTPHQYAVNACSLSYIYEVQGKQDESIALLIKAAIADIQSATKETVAMYKLADYLYKKGDLKKRVIS